MEANHAATAQFQVYLRIRPAAAPSQIYPVLNAPERFLTVEVKEDDEGALPTHITLNPPNDNRRRAVEKFGFTRVFEEQSSQLDVFHGTGVVPLVEGVLGAAGDDGRDGLLATLGVTGSGKSHTILGSKNQRGLTQLAVDLLFRSIASNIQTTTTDPGLHASISSSEGSEAQVLMAQGFQDAFYGDTGSTKAPSRAATPARVRTNFSSKPSSSLYPVLLAVRDSCSGAIPPVHDGHDCTYDVVGVQQPAHRAPSYMASTASLGMRTRAKIREMTIKADFKSKETSAPPQSMAVRKLIRPSALPQEPNISSTTVACDANAEYAILISMYEVYNDRIFDLLTPAARTAVNKDYRRRPLLFKSTEHSTDRKVVAGLRKVICGDVREALMVLEAGLHERRVAGTGSNSVSSRSHGFFCIEVLKRSKGRGQDCWAGSTLTIVDLAGSERARDTKTQGATLAEAGKINESLMYLGQCLQMQSDTPHGTKPNIVPFRQCKLTELLFSNSFPTATTSYTSAHHRAPQRAIMIVTADPLGDFNATSQILRYSALAREITIPRIPSVSSTILAAIHRDQEAALAMPPPSRPYSQSSSQGSAAPPILNRYASSFDHHAPQKHKQDSERHTMEIAALEIARMSEEIDGLRAELQLETERRQAAEAHNASLEEKILEIECDVREECYLDMEARMSLEIQKFKAQWEMERERGEEHVDRKIELLSRGLGALEVDGDNEEGGGENKENEVIESLEDENQRLRRQVAQLTRQREGQRSPSKKKVALAENRGFALEGQGERLAERMDMLRCGGGSSRGFSGESSESRSPGKKIRQLTARKWVGDEVDELV